MIITFEFFFDWANSSFFTKDIFMNLLAFEHYVWCWIHDMLMKMITKCIHVVRHISFWHSKFQFVWNSKILMSQLPDIHSHFVSPYLDFETPAWRLETASSDSRNDWVCSHWCSLSVVHRKLFGIRAPCKSLWYVLSAVSTFSFLLFAFFFCSLAQYPHSYLIYLNLLSQSLEVIVV
jgi:hypothetical protein